MDRVEYNQTTAKKLHALACTVRVLRTVGGGWGWGFFQISNLIGTDIRNSLILVLFPFLNFPLCWLYFI